MPERTAPGGTFTKVTMENAVRLWARSSVSLLDVRYHLLAAGQTMLHYRMPTSMFVYICGGPANVQLNDTMYATERFAMFHGGKGTLLSIEPAGDWLEYYMVMYKAEQPPFYKKELQRLLAHTNPFMQVYGFSPENPIFFVDKLQGMYDRWKQEPPMNQFYVKSAFYQLVYELYANLEKGHVRFIQPDLVASAKRFLDEQYMRPISLRTVSEMFPISGSQLSRLFKKREQKSLQEYLNEKRLEAAKRHLLRTKATIKEIAVGCGFTDELNLIRMFKKYYKMTPSDYRKKTIPGLRNNDIDNDSHDLYNGKWLVRPAHFTGDGEIAMFGQIRSKEFVLSAMLSLMLLVSACSSAAPANPGSPSPAPTQGQTAQNETTTGAETGAPQTRVVRSLKGDIEIPTEPKRIIGIPIEYRELLHSLGVTPIAAQNNNDEFPSYLGEDFKNVIKLGGGVELPFEAMLDADPDLIIASSWAAAETFDALNKIAPTVVIEDTDWRSTLPMLAEVLGKQEEAKRLLADYDAAVADARQRLQSIVGDGTVLMLQVNGKDYKAIGMKNGRADILYNALGLKPPTVDLDGESQLVVSMEKLPEYDPDYILLQLFDDEEQSRKAFDDLMNHPVFQNMRAFKNNNVFPIGHENGGKEWHLFSFSPQGNLYGIKRIVEVFEASLK
ncbi:iron complex transport system substrate-binding protein [Paenibacillus sp. UNCCL117]|uniref:AraC family transcriptional regulator n=1 Tax=unclassified Paenibacillus TaxID=185978 RepID=UPI0008866775|nr:MULTISPECIES: AraC family transcriptional regulator [unclassified Paenibacillus]SDC44655.1 iron complex transport system substrate-binding protein [Paenibacillus sp. cl123]SFW12688.1 iron complex transport system substrate-binding protein [Paenibacillus sp. UNCCL117]